jgi:FkbM family methyltransferase
VKISVPSVRLEEVVKEDVLLLKVDVEGWEWSVMQGAEALLKNYNVENIIMEYSPGML